MKSLLPDNPIELEAFQAHLPEHNYIYRPTGALWPAASVNASIKPVWVGKDKAGEDVFISASKWLDQNRAVEQMTWAPGEPQLIRDRLVLGGGFVDSPGSQIFNLYRPPPASGGDPKLAQRWIEHVDFVYPDSAGHVISWCAQRVQAPHIKVNHALVLGGEMGIGKDTLLEPVRRAVGYWNSSVIDPTKLIGRFNGFLKNVLLIIPEARDQGEINRYTLYEHSKAILAAPPETLTVDEKNRQEYAILNRVGVVFTSNHKDGLYLPPDDRRHYVAWSPRQKQDFRSGYWNDIWSYYENGGFDHVAAFLRQLDLDLFDPKAPPPTTEAFLDMVDAGRAPENAELNDLLDGMERPKAVYPAQLLFRADDSLKGWLTDRKNRKQIQRRLNDCGYVQVRNQDADDGLWKLANKRQAVYARRDLLVRDQIAAVNEIRDLEDRARQ